ncbi:hypothetical protein F5148DRAFT_1322130 [Russula earlei]|uniref:Uncharacterized protein n=1 Tax=Russula earlei TaxID=71964 RepID=A0ACC0U3N4_9AGAM|nr:hypothetical protein F5148DRAFT_1322130 [Russula earlei]
MTCTRPCAPCVHFPFVFHPTHIPPSNYRHSFHLTLLSSRSHSRHHPHRVAHFMSADYDNGSIRSPSTSLALPLNAFIPLVFKLEHGSSPHFDLRHDAIAVRLRLVPSQDCPSSIVLASATHLRTDPYDTFDIVTIALPKGSLPTAPHPSSLPPYSRARCP